MEFSMWFTKFKAFAVVNNFWQAINATQDVNLPGIEADAEALDRNDATSAAAVKAYDANTQAVAYVTMAFTEYVLMLMVDNACTADWASGRADLIVAALVAEYRPDDTISKAEFKKKLMQVSLWEGTSQEPVWKDCVKEKQYMVQLDKFDKIETVIALAPEEYSTIFWLWSKECRLQD